MRLNWLTAAIIVAAIAGEVACAVAHVPVPPFAASVLVALAGLAPALIKGLAQPPQ